MSILALQALYENYNETYDKIYVSSQGCAALTKDMLDSVIYLNHRIGALQTDIAELQNTHNTTRLAGQVQNLAQKALALENAWDPR